MATVQPSNSSELQLYRVLQRANLLQYFETFITQGGDDVQQLCEAGEDEFLEIMALVGMASKPLHVRRLQKALQEWVANPAAFEIPKKYPTHVMSMTGSSSSMSPTHALERPSSIQDYKVTPPQSSTISTSTPWSSQTGPRGVSPSEGSNLDDPSSSNSPQADFKDIMKDVLYNQDDPAYANMMNMTPVLMEHQITAIATAAAILAQELPPFEPKSMPKKQVSKEISAVMGMSPDDPNRMDALRKYAAIYGRFDSKRKNDRPMSLHEISVNEAAAQLCSHFPALLTRREELFPLARQVVRDSGYQYSKGHSRAAEVLVQPKVEQGEAIPSTSSVSPMSQSQETTFHDLQADLTQITMELSEMAKEQDRIRSALRVLLEANDHEQMKTLTAEMDVLNDRQAAMTKKRQRIVNSIAKYRKGASKYSVPTVCLATKSSPRMSPPHGMSGSKAVSTSNHKYSSYGFHDDQMSNNPLNTLYMAALQNQKDSLFEEGLRIATQYGMSDFAKELIGMKSSKGDETGVKLPTENGGAAVYNGFASPSSTVPVSSASDVVSSSSYAMASSTHSKSTPSPSSSASFMSSTSVTSNGSKASCTVSTTRSYPKSIAVTTVAATHKSHHEIPPMKTSVTSHPTPSSTPTSNISGADDTMDVGAVDSSNASGKSTPSNDRPTAPVTTTPESHVAQGSTTTTTTITTKSGQVIEVETRRSSRRKNGEPDYYLINGGEKRFRSSNSRRSSSTSSERARRLSSSSSTSSVTCATPTSTTPVKQSRADTHANGDSIIRLNVSDLRFKNGSEVQKVILDVNQGGEGAECTEAGEEVMTGEDNVCANGDTDKRIMRKKGRGPTYTGQKLLIGDIN